MLPSNELILCEQGRCRCSAKLFGACISVKRDIRVVPGPLSTEGAPIDCWIENVSSGRRSPFQPGVRFTASSESLSDNEPDIICTARMHCIVKRDRFPFAIGKRAGFDFLRCFPLSRESVRNCTQIPDPMVDQCDGQTLVFMAVPVRIGRIRVICRSYGVELTLM